MFRYVGLIAVCACIVAGVGCDGGRMTDPTPLPLGTVPVSLVTVQFEGRVVNDDTGGPAGNVARFGVSALSWRSHAGQGEEQGRARTARAA
jgi:hypothetical protein